MSIGSDGIGPHADSLTRFSLWLRPDGLVVVQEIGEMILDQVFAGHTEVHWVPVGEFSPQLSGD